MVRKRRDLTLKSSTEQELATAAAIEPGDIARAALAWHEVAPVQFRELPNAILAEEAE